MNFITWPWLAIMMAFSAAGAEGVVKGTATAPDGLPIVYEVRGAGEHTLVLVHCWACNRTFWREQVEVLAQDYRVVTLDLGGHGESGKNREPWTVIGLAGDVQAVVDRLELKQFLLIGHSMGGPVSLEAARRMPDRVLGIVSIDTLHNVEFKISPEMIEPVATRFDVNFKGVMAEMVRMMFLPDADPATVDQVVALAQTADPKVAMALFRDFPNLDLQAMMASVKAPIRGVNAAPSSPMAPISEIEINRRHGDYDAVIMEGVGHFLLLEKPEPFNRLLKKTVAEIIQSSKDRP